MLRKSPLWMPPCFRCEKPLRERSGPGKRICQSCFDTTYNEATRDLRGYPRKKIRPCPVCGRPRLAGARRQLCERCQPWASSIHAFKKYGLTPDQYELLLESQGGVCAVCRRLPQHGRRLSVDHLHSNPPRLRGLLCTFCNYQLLGAFRERIDWFRNAIRYIEDPPAPKILPNHKFPNQSADAASDA